MKKALSVFIGCLSVFSLLSCGGNENTEDPLITKYRAMACNEDVSFDFASDTDGWESNIYGQNTITWIKNNKKGKPGLKVYGKYTQEGEKPNASIFNKFLITKEKKILEIDTNVITDVKTNLRVRAITFDNSQPYYESLEISNGEFIYDENGYCKLDGCSQTILTYDLSPLIGKQTVISIDYKNNSEDINEGLYINGINLLERRSSLDSNTSWIVNDILSKWELRGNILNSSDDITLLKKQTSASIFNVIRPLTSHGFLKIEMSKDELVEANFTVLADDHPLTCLNAKEINFSGKLTRECLIYDLNSYLDCSTKLEIKNEKNIELKIHSIELIASKSGYVFDTDWNTDTIYSDWSRTGSVVKHGEGTCIEYNANNPSSISNLVKVTDQYYYFNMCFRKFVRSEGAQDIDPRIEVYVNGTLIRYIGATTDYASVTSDEYSRFTYDLTSYIGQKVTIKLLSVAGPHACFNHIYLNNQISE